MRYAIATGLRGFRSESLRVLVLREEAGLAWVVTADLLDAGTALVLDATQVEPEVQVTDLRHSTGLVSFAGAIR